MGSCHVRAASALLAAGAILVAPAEARITRLEITSVEPAFQGRSFEPVGAYERVRGRAFGEVDPDSPAISIVQDIRLAPRNSRGLVEYSTKVDTPLDERKEHVEMECSFSTSSTAATKVASPRTMQTSPEPHRNQCCIQPRRRLHVERGLHPCVVWLGS